MTNDLKNFLEHEMWRFLYGHIFIDNQPITDTKEGALREHDIRIINFVLDLVEKEVEKKKVFIDLAELMCDIVYPKDISTIIKQLRV